MPRRHLAAAGPGRARRSRSCAPASPGSGPSSSCRRSSRPTCWPRPRRRPQAPDLPAGRRHRPAVPHHRPARARWTWTRRCTSSGAAAASGCATPSPTSAAFVRPGRRDRRRGAPARSRRSTARTRAPRCTRRSLSEGAASLLPDQVRPAVLWTIDLDADGEQTAVDVRRALVRSRGPARLRRRAGRWSTRGTADERLLLLAEVGKLRMAARGRARRRQPADPGAGGRRGRRHVPAGVPRDRCPVESWNEQISLMTGMAAADLMLHGEVGVLRTLPNAPDGALRPAAPRGPGARRRLAGRQVVRRGGARPRPGEPAARGAARGGDLAAARRRLHGVRRRRAGARHPRRGRRGVRARDRAAAPAGRPLRRRGVPRAVRRRRGARLGPLRAAAAAGRDGRRRPPGRTSWSGSASR